MSHPDDQLLGPVMRAADGAAPVGDCPDAEVLALYAEQALAADELGGIERHVAGCGRCQATLVAFARGAEPAGAATDVVAATVAWWAGWRWMVPVAASMAVVAVAVWIGRTPADQVAESARVAESASPAPADAGGDRLEAPAAVSPAPQGTRDDAARDAAPPARGRALGVRHPSAEAERKAEASPASPAPAFADARAAAEAVGGLTAANAAAGRESAQALREAQAAPPPAPLEARARSEVAAAPLPPPPPAAPAQAPAAAKAVAGSASGAAARDAAASGGARQSAMAELTGTVSYRTRNALVPGAVIEVRLLDVSRADAPADTLARTEIVTTGEQVPVPFTLRYAPEAIQPRRRYVVQATISIDGRVQWRTTTAHPVFVDGAATTSVAVVVEPVR